MAEKRCSTCGEFKPIEDFYVRKSGSGHNVSAVGKPVSYCKSCTQTRLKAYRDRNHQKMTVCPRCSAPLRQRGAGDGHGICVTCRVQIQYSQHVLED